jgi:inosose dehydratase
MKADAAGAPVSFGVFEMTPEGAETVGPDEMLEILVRTGYTGIDLGPLGFLGRGDELRRRLDRFGVDLAGGWVELPFSDDEAFEDSLPELEEALRVFSDAAASSRGRLPKPTLADHGSAERKSTFQRTGGGLDGAGWERLARNAERAASRVRAAGFEPTFHHHAGTFVEAPDEIDRFLELVDMDLTLDTGHLLLGGGDPLEAVRRWGPRINHLHLKDVDTARLNGVIGAGGGMTEVWSSGAFVAFGRGDIDLPAVLNGMDELGYDGWIVVEQDVLPATGSPLAEFLRHR